MAKPRLKFTPFDHAGVEAVFAQYPERVRARLLVLRELIFETAALNDSVGPIEETLRWGEPAYLTTQSGSGSMIRLNRLNPRNGGYAMYFHCQTDLVATFRGIHADVLRYDGNRAIVFREDEPLLVAELRQCIELALTYKINKRAATGLGKRDARAKSTSA